MWKRAYLFILVTFNFFYRADGEPFIRLNDQMHEAPRITQAYLHGDGVRIEFIDGDQGDLWLAMLCTGNKDRPIACYQSSTTLVYPHMKNQLSYIPKLLSAVWWVEIRDLFGATAQQKLNEKTSDKEFKEVLLLESRQKEGAFHLSFRVDERAIPLNIWVKAAQGRVLYQGSFVTSGTKSIIFDSVPHKNLKLYYSSVSGDGQMDLTPQ